MIFINEKSLKVTLHNFYEDINLKKYSNTLNNLAINFLTYIPNQYH